MKGLISNNVHFTPWHLRERTRGLQRDIAKAIQSNFFYSFLFLPRQKREAIIDVYGFCREVDDIVDDLIEQSQPGRAHWIARAELEKWRAELDQLYLGNPTRPLSHRLRRALERFPIPKEYFEEMINGCEMDLFRQRYQTFDELYEYCYRVAAIAGLMCIEIFTYRSPQTKEYAVRLGIALQLTNILRDLKEDANRGRIYLPQEDLRRFGYSEEDLQRQVFNDNFIELMRFECERARDYYRRAAECLPEEDRPTLTAAITMGRIYYRLLEEIEQVNYDVFNHQVRLHRPERFMIALSEWARSGMGTRGGGDAAR
ncbi:MAG TPA: presqualene diphosphate synthase HpnD [Blastocatellia bacterium]|nr:presqualene diphosphate synthase HpnD [Blastocatellia bacterium]